MGLLRFFLFPLLRFHFFLPFLYFLLLRFFGSLFPSSLPRFLFFLLRFFPLFFFLFYAHSGLGSGLPRPRPLPRPLQPPLPRPRPRPRPRPLFTEASPKVSIFKDFSSAHRKLWWSLLVNESKNDDFWYEGPPSLVRSRSKAALALAKSKSPSIWGPLDGWGG